MAKIIANMPCWYLGLLVGFCLYYAVRGVVGQRRHYLTSLQKNGTIKKSLTELVFYDYIQEFLFKVVITASSFVALLIAEHIFSSLKSPNDVGAGTAVFLVFLVFWGVTGASGYLTHLIVSGRFPSLR
jgi:quinol-cytochrome oxidoreductase complex cytochrome b subunit